MSEHDRREKRTSLAVSVPSDSSGISTGVDDLFSSLETFASTLLSIGVVGLLGGSGFAVVWIVSNSISLLLISFVYLLVAASGS